MTTVSTETKTKKHGGARKGAGRPATSPDTITVKGLLEMVHKKGNGKNYEEILIDDFMKARSENDRG